ncbi:MAG: hypothetical protein HKN27_11565 [Silicimonas sp.]|nr:hypothetical protein [Silicimonas sp.]
MANEDSFINEVSEEVRRDKLYKLMRKYGWIAIAAVVLTVGGAAFFEWQKATARTAAQAKGDALVAALAEDTAEARASALREVPVNDTPGGGAVLALLQAAGAVEADDTDAALASLETLANDAEAPALYRDLAILKSVIIGAGVTPPEERISKLSAIQQPGNPYRLLALEQRAYAEVEQGNSAAAIETLTGILADAEVTEDLRRRATQLIVALGGVLDQS